MQCDEKWSFVGKKRRHCDPTDPGDHDKGDCWDHVALDAEHRLVLGVVVGRRDNAAALTLMRDVWRKVPKLAAPAAAASEPTKKKKKKKKKQQQQQEILLLVTDGYLGYPTAVRLAFFGGSPAPPPGLRYAVVQKRYDQHGHVVSVARRAVHGTERQLGRAEEGSPVSTVANTAFVERHNATDRHRNARKARRTYRFSKDWGVHEAVTYFTYYTYNFCCCVRTLRRKRPDGTHDEPRTPAMSADLADHVWTLREWLQQVVTGISS